MKAVYDFDSPRERSNFLALVRELRGKKRVEIKRYAVSRSLEQNAAYWAMVCEPFSDWLSEQYGEVVTLDQAHEILKDALLRVPVTNEHGEVVLDVQGNPLMRTRSTTELDKPAFSRFFDDCRNLLKQLADIDVPDPDRNYCIAMKGDPR